MHCDYAKMKRNQKRNQSPVEHSLLVIGCTLCSLFGCFVLFFFFFLILCFTCGELSFFLSYLLFFFNLFWIVSFYNELMIYLLKKIKSPREKCGDDISTIIRSLEFLNSRWRKLVWLYWQRRLMIRAQVRTLLVVLKIIFLSHSIL